jgi:hypothetical protein
MRQAKILLHRARTSLRTTNSRSLSGRRRGDPGQTRSDDIVPRRADLPVIEQLIDLLLQRGRPVEYLSRLAIEDARGEIEQLMVQIVGVVLVYLADLHQIFNRGPESDRLAERRPRNRR